MTKSLLCLAALTLAVVSAAPARADEATTEAAFVENHVALEVAKQCLGLHYGQDEGYKINQRIVANAGMPMPGRALGLIRQARTEAWELVGSKGCASAPAMASLEKFKTDIAPAIQ